ncbi:MAG: aminotransferase class V-fold PLP-dependent enzyme [Byssovorax sp.]
MSTVDFHALRSRFPLLDERLYFASQCLGPMPRAMLDDLDAYRRSLFLRKRALVGYVERMLELTEMIERLINAPPGSVCLRDSATAAQAAIASSIAPEGERRRVIVSNQAFHSTRYLWKAQAARGFEVQEIVPAEGAVVSTEQYVAAIDGTTRVVEAALVSSRSGALLDARAVIGAARAASALTIIDAYQAVGVVPIDVQALDVDVLVGGSHKWLGGGGMGLAFMYVRPSLAASLTPAYPGWVGHASLAGYAEEFTPAEGAKRFQQGTPSMEPIYTARAGIALALEIGVAPIRARSLALTGRMIDRALARGLAVRTPRRDEARGGMICVDAPGGEAVVEALEARGIDIDYRPGAGLRIAPHFCHREDECDRVIDVLAETPGAR